jgi:hypothetical protein
VERGWGVIVRKTPDTALYSIYVSTFWGFVIIFSEDEQWCQFSSRSLSYC